MKKVGWYLMSVLPLLALLVLQVVSGFFLILWYMFRYGVENGAQDHLMEIMVITQALTLLVMGLWYLLLVKPKGPVNVGFRGKGISRRAVAGCFCLAIGFQCLVHVFLTIWSFVSPEQIIAYNKLMEESGVGELTVFSAIAMVIMAPLGEELVFRGITVEYLRRGGARFWVLNGVQALFFGIAHLNLVQGAYAFFGGLLNGYVLKRYGTLWAPILLQLFINAYATFGNPVLVKLQEGNSMAFTLGSLVVGAVTFPLGMRLVLMDAKREERWI